MTSASTPEELVDVAVIGAGSVGAMALWHLSKVPGLSVLGIEQYGRAHGLGSFAGESRLFRMAYKEGGLYLPLLTDARRQWLELEQEAGTEILLQVGALSIGTETQPEMVATRETIDNFGLPHRYLDTEELRKEYPQHDVHDSDVGILDPQGAGLRPEVAVCSALRLAEANGVRMRYRCAVEAVEPGDNGVTIRTAQGVVRARTAIVTTGSWATELLPGVRNLVHVQRLALSWFMPADIGRYLPERFPVFMRDIDDVHFFGAPSLDGYSVKVSPGHLDLPSAPTLAELPDLPDDFGAHLAAQVTDFFPDMNPEPVRLTAHHEMFTADRVPIVDRDPTGSIVAVAGLSGHGFKLAPTFGRIARELAVDGTSTLCPREFTLAAHRQRAAALA
ncbi:N-methyltryptophan oxidase [Gordonia paraffinivorans]|uniref:N-methyl-L-tryptophan oxidase n=1 Tax=Gordonia paraffinivorans TaxID=175628 RepID=UPI001C92F9D0|nr:N-methyl-L-tryptophan oxidase [Gordonia paraffinivorans]MBY4575711.1 N-methyltryptophan oxidase [Gordonia paraffinivorans]